jgi:hypothetical protein
MVFLTLESGAQHVHIMYHVCSARGMGASWKGRGVKAPGCKLLLAATYEAWPQHVHL